MIKSCLQQSEALIEILSDSWKPCNFKVYGAFKACFYGKITPIKAYFYEVKAAFNIALFMPYVCVVPYSDLYLQTIIVLNATIFSTLFIICKKRVYFDRFCLVVLPLT